MKTLLFLYGTLKRGCRNHHLMHRQEYLGPTRTEPRYMLHDSGRYPCLVESEANGRAILGELWAVDAAALTQLDEFEEVGHTFARREIALENVTGPAFAYFFVGDVHTFPDCGELWTEA